jgi:hypothetical protein
VTKLLQDLRHVYIENILSGLKVWKADLKSEPLMLLCCQQYILVSPQLMYNSLALLDIACLISKKKIAITARIMSPYSGNLYNNLTKTFILLSVACACPYSSQTSGPRLPKFSQAGPLLHALEFRHKKKLIFFLIFWIWFFFVKTRSPKEGYVLIVGSLLFWGIFWCSRPPSFL